MRRALVVLLSLLLAALLSLSSVSAQRESYNEPLARRLLSFSTAAYCKEADLQAWNCGEYCDQLSTFRIAGTVNPVISWEAPLLSFAGVDTDPETGAKNLLLVFRGTYPLSLVAWFDDARFQPASLPQLCETCVAPWGFLDLWHNLRDGTMSMMRRLIHDHPDLPLTITGHSLGGALAMLAAIDISAEFNKQANTIYTFAQPMTGNDAFVNAWERVFADSSSYRVTQSMDPAPHLPSAAFTSSIYEHTPDEIFYPDNLLGTAPRVCVGRSDPSCTAQYASLMSHVWSPLVFAPYHWTYLQHNLASAWIDCNVFDLERLPHHMRVLLERLLTPV